MLARLRKRLLEYHLIEGLGPEPLKRKGKVPDARVEENREHGHNVTKVTGLETCASLCMYARAPIRLMSHFMLAMQIWN